MSIGSMKIESWIVLLALCGIGACGKPVEPAPGQGAITQSIHRPVERVKNAESQQQQAADAARRKIDEASQ